jgi:hypothetical protein
LTAAARAFAAVVFSQTERFCGVYFQTNAHKFTDEEQGKDLIVHAFRKFSGQMRKVFSELSPEELQGLEVALKVGKRRRALKEES